MYVSWFTKRIHTKKVGEARKSTLLLISLRIFLCFFFPIVFRENVRMNKSVVNTIVN